MIDFATLKGLAIPEGVVTKIEDASGRVLWELVTSKPVVLEVEKIVSSTYAGETTYENEEFILFDIYPKSGGTVSVTYGGLTKNITDTSGAAEPNAQEVFFGTFNGVSDSVATPASGTLTIEGDYAAFAVGAFNMSSKTGGNCGCITDVVAWGNITSIAAGAFSKCKKLAISSLPSAITSIGNRAFYSCFSLPFGNSFFNNGLVEIGESAFDLSQAGDYVSDENDYVQAFEITIPATVKNMGNSSFEGPIIDAHSYMLFKQMIMLPTTPPVLPINEYGPLGEIQSGKPFSIIVPKGCGEAYKAAEGWSYYAQYITEVT